MTNPKKEISVVISGELTPVDCSQYMPIIEHPWFQRLQHVKQLSWVHNKYPDATYTRKSHAIGTLDMARKIIGSLAKDGRGGYDFSDDIVAATEIAALVHDIGHPACAHAAEPVLFKYCGYDHNHFTRCVVSEMKPEIEQCGGNFDMVLEFLNDSTPEAQLIHKGLLSADKLDYSGRDMYSIGLPYPNIRRMIEYLYFDGTNYGVEDKAMGDAENFIQAWWDAYRTVYLHKSAELPTVMFQRALYSAIKNNVIEYENVWTMDDEEIMHAMRYSSDEKACIIANRLRDRRLFKRAGVLKLPERGDDEPTRNKSFVVDTLSIDEQREFNDSYEDLDAIDLLERHLCNELGVSECDLMLTTSPFNSRFVPKDIDVWYNSGNGRFGTVLEKERELKAYLVSQMERHYALRLCVAPERRDDVYDKIKDDGVLRDLILGGLND